MKRTISTKAAIPDSFKQLFGKTAPAVIKRQDNKAPDAGELRMTGLLMGYPVVREVDGRKRNVNLAEPPEKQLLKGKEDPLTGVVPTFAKKIQVTVQLIKMNEVENITEKLSDGDSWRVFAKCAFQPEAAEYLKDNYKDFYAGSLKTKNLISEFIDQEGELLTQRWITLRAKHDVKFEVGDTDNCVFRVRTDTGRLLVTARTGLTLPKCTVTQWVRLNDPKKDGDESMLRATTKVECKGTVRLSDDHDFGMPMSERVLRQENPHRHSMIPIKELADAPDTVSNSFMDIRPDFQSPEGSENGVTLMPMPSENLRDFVSTFKEETSVRVVFRAFVFQWHKTAEKMQGVEVYSVKIAGYNDEWRSYGIPDQDCFGHIMLANPIWTFVEVGLYKKATLQLEENQRLIAGEEEETNEEMKQLKGHYVWSIRKATPNYLRMLPVTGIAVSAKWVKESFSDFVGTKGKKGKERTTMDFTPRVPGYANPLHEEGGSESAVVSLGNPMVDNPEADTPKPLCHGFSGDFWPRMEKSDFYVLTSHRFEPGSEDASLLGARPDGNFEPSEALIDRLIQEEKVYWWLFAVNRDALHYTHDDVEQERPVKKAHVEPEPEEEPAKTTKVAGSMKKKKKKIKVVEAEAE